jgi:dTDP-glucose 4,6-dehydratase
MSRIVVTGGAGFVGSHVCDALLDRGDEVIAVDNLLTGSRANVDTLSTRAGFTFLEQDVSVALDVDGPVDAVMHLASPASPADFERIPLEIMRVGSAGTLHGLELAERAGATFFLASTSEVYGDPLVHPQPESYLGNVSCTGPRSVYDEAKRYAEALTSAFHRHRGVDVRIVRIFNTYGPRMRLDDGRVVSNLVTQALAGEPLTIYGTGEQTRSFVYVDDEVRGLLALLDSDLTDPVNIGSDGEFTVAELAEIVLEVTGSSSEVVRMPRPVDDPQQRKPDLTRARTLLGWEPTVPLREGIARTAEDFRARLAARP